MTIPDTPEARNAAVVDESPAWENRMGAYYEMVRIYFSRKPLLPTYKTASIPEAYSQNNKQANVDSV